MLFDERDFLLLIFLESPLGLMQCQDHVADLSELICGNMHIYDWRESTDHVPQAPTFYQ